MIFGMRIWLNPEKLAALEMTTTDILLHWPNKIYRWRPVLLAATAAQYPGFEYSVLTNSRINTKRTV